MPRRVRALRGGLVIRGMKLEYDDEALRDLEDIFRWIAHDSPAAAKSAVDRLFSSTELLISFPFMGHIPVATPEHLNWRCRVCHTSWFTKLIARKSASSLPLCFMEP